MKEFRSVIVGDNNIKILDGSTGIYDIDKIKKCSILNEDAHFRGKTDPFVHQVLGNTAFFSIIGNGTKVYVGLRLITEEGNKLAIYVSQKAVLFDSDEYKKDFKEAKRIKKLIDNRVLAS